jgi:hypothetical protein
MTSDRGVEKWIERLFASLRKFVWLALMIDIALVLLPIHGLIPKQSEASVRPSTGGPTSATS